jgi:hypothetical protein
MQSKGADKVITNHTIEAKIWDKHVKTNLLINQNHLKSARLTGIKESRNLPQAKNPYLDMKMFFTGQYISNIIKLEIRLPPSLYTILVKTRYNSLKRISSLNTMNHPDYIFIHL